MIATALHLLLLLFGHDSVEFHRVRVYLTSDGDVFIDVVVVAVWSGATAAVASPSAALAYNKPRHAPWLWVCARACGVQCTVRTIVNQWRVGV